MKLKFMGRAALLTCASLVLGLGLTSCATSTLGYLFVTTSQYGQVASLRLDINSGAIKGVSCNTSNGDQQNCITGSGGTNPTKLIAAQGDSLMYVLDAPALGTIGPGTVSLLTLGPSGSVYTTGETFQSSGQNPVDMYLNSAGNYLYVLDEYQPSPANGGTVAGCATPTPTTCPGDITVFSIGSKGNLNVVLDIQNNNSTYFPLGTASLPAYVAGPLNSGYGGNRMYAAGGYLYVLDQGTPGVPQIDDLQINPSNGQLTEISTGPTQNTSFVSLSSITSGGSYIYVSDYVTGQIWTYVASSGALSLGGNGFVCPGMLTGGATCLTNPKGNQNIQLDSLIFISNAGSTGSLYAADYAIGSIFTLVYTGTGAGLQPSSNGGITQLGTNVTCMTISSGTTFLYASGQANVSGEQVDTTTGNLTTNDHTTTAASFTGAVPCLTFSPRT
jgi:hypothetical protein